MTIIKPHRAHMSGTKKGEQIHNETFKTDVSLIRQTQQSRHTVNRFAHHIDNILLDPKDRFTQIIW